jgi:hypothetical protein
MPIDWRQIELYHFYLYQQNPNMLTRADRVHASMQLRQPRGTDLAGQPNSANVVDPAGGPTDRNQTEPAGDAPVDGTPAGGTKRATVLIDEVKFLIDHQYMTASQAIWHIFGMPMHYSLFSVIASILHTLGLLLLLHLFSCRS